MPPFENRQLIPQLSLEQVEITDELMSRTPKARDDAPLDAAILRLLQSLSREPQDVVKHLAESAMLLCGAGSVGISVLENENGVPVFRWRALTGKLATDALGMTMPRHESPCGMVLDRRADLLFAYPEKHFPFPAPVHPPIVEALLSPFYSGGDAVGTIWVVAHDDRCKFDLEDVRILHELCKFATSAYTLLKNLGHVQDLHASI